MQSVGVDCTDAGARAVGTRDGREARAQNDLRRDGDTGCTVDGTTSSVGGGVDVEHATGGVSRVVARRTSVVTVGEEVAEVLHGVGADADDVGGTGLNIGVGGANEAEAAGRDGGADEADLDGLTHVAVPFRTEMDVLDVREKPLGAKPPSASTQMNVR